jgi:signal transduction histidine kinase
MRRRDFLRNFASTGLQLRADVRRLGFLSFILLLSLIACPFAYSSDQTKRILLVHSFGRDFKPWSEYARAIREELERQTRWRIDIMDQVLAGARVDGDNPETPFMNYLEQLYAAEPVDLIITTGAPAAHFFQRHRHKFFTAAPLLMAAVSQSRLQLSGIRENDTVVAVNNDHVAAFESLLQVLPATKTVMVVIGNSASEKRLREGLEPELKPFEGRIRLQWTDDLSFEELLKAAATLPPHSAIYWYSLSVDAAGVGHEGGKALTRVHAVANSPIFSFADAYFDGELLGGPMQSVAEASRQIASVAVRILGGEKAGDIKTPVSQLSRPKYDWRELQRWGISESNLPPGSEILFREPTVWERYTWQITLALTILLVQAGLISVLLLEHRRRRLAEVQSRQRMDELAHVNRFSTAGELSASIAHEINQPLGSILANAEAAQTILKSRKPDIAELSEILGDIINDDQRAAEVIQRLRSLLKKAPSELRNLDLNDVARETVKFLSALAIGRKVELVSVLTPDALPILGDRIQLQQVILNLVVNGIDAMRDTLTQNRIISIQSSRVENFAELSVSDNGAGIPEGNLSEIFEPFFTSKAEGMGMGLSIARTIIEAHDGQIWAGNRDYGGASFRIRLPLIR